MIPVIPGPILGYCGLLALMPTEKCPSTTLLVVFGVLVVVVTIVDYVIPSIGARKFNCSRAGTTGCFIGTIVGLFFAPVGIFLGPFLGAVACELVVGRSLKAAAWGGVGALFGFLSGVFLKLTLCIVMAVFFVRLVLN